MILNSTVKRKSFFRERELTVYFQKKEGETITRLPICNNGSSETVEQNRVLRLIREMCMVQDSLTQP